MADEHMPTEFEFGGTTLSLPPVSSVPTLPPPPPMPVREYTTEPPPRTDAPLLGSIRPLPPLVPAVAWPERQPLALPPVTFATPPMPQMPMPSFAQAPPLAVPQATFAAAPPPMPLPLPSATQAPAVALPPADFAASPGVTLPPPAEVRGYTPTAGVSTALADYAAESVAPDRDWRHGQSSSNFGISGVRTHSSLLAWPDAESGPKTLSAVRSGWAFSYQGPSHHGMQRRQRQQEAREQQRQSQKLLQKHQATRHDFTTEPRREEQQQAAARPSPAPAAPRPAVPQHYIPATPPPPQRPLPPVPLAPGAPLGPGAHHAAGVTREGLAAAEARIAGYQHTPPRPAYVPPPPPVPTPVRKTP